MRATPQVIAPRTDGTEYPAPDPSPAERSERLAFTFCKLGTVGLLAWALTPPVLVLLAALGAVALYARALGQGLRRSRCVLRKPALIIGFWGAVALADAAWLLLR